MPLTPVAPKPPFDEQPIADTGNHSPAWTAYHQRMSDQVNALPTQLRTGTVAGDDAQAGQIGEYLSTVVAIGSAVSLTSGVALDVATLALTAGDWDVSANVITNPAGSTTTQDFKAGISDVVNALPGIGPFAEIGAAAVAGRVQGLSTGTVRKNLSAGATVHLVVNCTFGVSTMAAYGTLNARRMR